VHREWYENGQLHYEYNLLHGKLHGKCPSWHRNGQLWLERNFLHGILHGVYRRWDPADGRLWLDEEWFYGNRIR